jgi:DNA-binding CsgD family transcriptional regulator
VWTEHPQRASGCPFAVRRIYVWAQAAYRGAIMVMLGRADFEAIVGFLARLDSADTADPYAPEVLEALADLVPCDRVGYDESDVEAQRFSDSTPVSATDDALYWALGPCPITDYRVRTGDPTAARISDVTSRTRWHASPLYREYYAPFGWDHILDLNLSPARHAFRTLTLLRGHDVADFSERDRAVLELLRPHLRAREARAALVRHATGGEAEVGPSTGPPGSLTVREREIVAMVSAGKTNAEIATELWVTPATVKKHLENVYLKLGVGSRAAAASRVQADGWGSR